MIKVSNLSFSYGLSPLLEEASFSVGAGMKAGLVGPNGAGKSTLFRLLSKKDTPNAGRIIVEGTVEDVPQEVKHDILLEESKTIREYIDHDSVKEDFELRTMLANIGLEHELNDSPVNLSGGQKTRLALCRALLKVPDILLLDEPTNFLDTAGKRWIMQFLSTYPKTVILISHDLKLLDKSIDKILAINTHSKKIDEYRGNYSTYMRLRKEREALIKRNIETEQKHIKHMEQGLIKMQRFTSDKGVRQRTLLKKRIAKLKENLPPVPQELKIAKIRLPEPLHIGEAPIIAKNIYKSFGDNQILKNVSLTLLRGERIALIGPNGVGKSTFIKILLDTLKADSGTIRKDELIKIGYYSQEFETLDLNKTMIETVSDISHLNETVLRPLLARFLFQGKKIFQLVGSLSGGEKTRLSIACLLFQHNNVLILDEPTTYLDVLSQRIILEALKDYQGAMIVVSHTEEFIKELRPAKALLLPENRFDVWRDEYLEKVTEI